MNSRATAPQDEYRARLAAVHRELGIPPDYAARFRLAPCPEADELVAIGADVYGRPQQLAPRAAEHWQAMRTQAQQGDIVLLVVSAFRSVEQQRELIARKLARGQPLEEILRVNAAPGYSEHHTGCALDLTTSGFTPLAVSFETTDAFAWLMTHANRFGFRLSYPRDNRHGIAYEPWHWACLEDS